MNSIGPVSCHTRFHKVCKAIRKNIFFRNLELEHTTKISIPDK